MNTTLRSKNTIAMEERHASPSLAYDDSTISDLHLRLECIDTRCDPCKSPGSSCCFVNGDQFGARALSNGTVEVYRNGVLIATRDISAWPYNASGGYIGLWFGNAKDALIDDFGGGTIP